MTDYHSQYNMTIGIECHVQLATKTKLFSPADNDARGAEPNSKTHPIDFGLPGMLPVLNKEALRLAVRAGKALNTEIAQTSRFDRKHYFYPDLPNGYQITQMYEPIILSGYVDAPLDSGETIRVRIHHAHMEADAGKLTHFSNFSLVDLNRAGTPLIEIVSEPDIHSSEGARAYATELYRLMTYAGITHGDLFHGNMRFDVNISIAPKGSNELGTRAEIKNLNSFRSVERAAEYEFNRQAELLSRGERVVQETRGWSDDSGKTSSQRSKENAQDYRYMPDADIPPIILVRKQIEDMQANMPTLPPAYRKEWEGLGVDKSVINQILAVRDHAELVSGVLKEGGVRPARRTANWIASNLSAENDGELKTADVSDILALAEMVEKNEVSSNGASELFNELMNGANDPRALAEAKSLLQNSDTDAIGAIVDSVLADPDSKKALEDIKNGNERAVGYLVGQVMKQSKGQANPALAQMMIRERL